MAVVPARLPGVYFEAQPPRRAGELPRMDVAAFVGFARSGPLHLPVAVEDPGRYRELFGEDLRLAWDGERGRRACAYLGPAVEAFLRNGGRRCWVVRVADETTAYTHRFALPGLIDAAAGTPAVAAARSPGAWAGELRIGTVLARERFPVQPQPLGLDGEGLALALGVAAQRLRRGDLIEVAFAGRPIVLFLFVSEVQPAEGGVRVRGFEQFWRRIVPSGSPPEPGSGTVTVPLTPAEVDLLKTGAGGSPGLVPSSAYRLTFDLLSWHGGRVEHRLFSLAFHPDHPRYWATLPDDAVLFRLKEGREEEVVGPERAAFLAEAARPRFPLAGPQGVEGASEEPAARYLPAGMAIRPDPELAAEPEAPPGLTDLELDGLARFEAAHFLDPDLMRVPFGALLGEARHKHYERVLGGGEPLRGLHALLPVEEVSMAAVPDAVHRGWSREVPELEEPLRAPVLDPVRPADENGRAVITWSASTGARLYVVETDRSGDFTNPVILYRGDRRQTEFFFSAPCPETSYFRVRAERFGAVSAWSNNRAATLPRPEFLECGTTLPAELELHLELAVTGSPEPGPLLRWRFDHPQAVRPGDGFELEEAFEFDFQAPERIDVGSETRYALPEERKAARYYRVRARRGGVTGPWSNTVRLGPAGSADWSLLPVEEYEEERLNSAGEAESPSGTLLAVHRALARFCAARADLLALLSLPGHFRTAEVLEHVARLVPPPEPSQAAASLRGAPAPPLTFGERKVLDYCAVYHPWPVTARAANEREAQRTTIVAWAPPDGAIAGSIAAQTLAQGAWVAPANRPLQGAIALEPKLGAGDWARLHAVQVNLIREDSRGFLVLNAETLSADKDLRPVNVRRLLILLQRLALREGGTYVFEPNSQEFRSLVRQRFQRMLNSLYLRGALAGRRTEEAYRVVVDETVNPPQSTEQGRFIVELRVAPSRPLAYLNVRLVQSAPEQLSVEEF